MLELHVFMDGGSMHIMHSTDPGCGQVERSPWASDLAGPHPKYTNTSSISIWPSTKDVKLPVWIFWLASVRRIETERP
jgi:hypothetical protein